MLIVVSGVLGLLLVGGGVAAVVMYDRATRPDRSAPDVAVDNYLRAFLVDRDDTKAAQFTCAPNASDLGPLRALRDDLRAREERFATTFSTSWGKLVPAEGNQTRIYVDLLISARIDGVSQSDRQPWQFELARSDDGWRVCRATSGG